MAPVKYEEYASRYNLRRFEDAHRNSYTSALKEIQSGRKQSHWMWYIFPQLRGLGHSRNSEYYGIADRDEAMMFLHHPVLGKNIKDFLIFIVCHSHYSLILLISSVAVMSLIKVKPNHFLPKSLMDAPM